MILEAVNDKACLSQLTAVARELARNPLTYQLAARLGSCRAVYAWLHSLPQSDDDGKETLQAIVCDVPQRLRVFPDDPNCFERTLAALALCEVLEPETPRCAVTIERPVRHTSLAELRDDRWEPIDLFPRRRNFAGLEGRNASGAELGKDIVQGLHRYVGKPILTAYGLGGVADQIGEAEDHAMGRSKPKTPPPPAAPKPEATTAASPSAPPPPKTTSQGEAPDATEEDRTRPRPRFAAWPPYDLSRAP